MADLDEKLTFEQRAKPVREGVTTGALDPVGSNYTTFEEQPERPVRRKKPAQPMTRLGSIY